MAKKIGHKAVEISGTLCIALAVVNMVMDYYGRWKGYHAYEAGTGLSIIAMSLVGVVALVISQALKNLEDRISPKDERDNHEKPL